MARKQYPSDHRRWFRVMEDILDDPGYRNLKPAEKVAWIDLLALFNRHQAHRTANCIVLPWSRAMPALGSQNRRGACARAARLAREVGAHFSRVPEGLLCHIPKWAKMQGLTPTGFPPTSAGTPCTTPTPTALPLEESEKPSPLLNLLGKFPGEADEKEAWLEHELALIEAEAEAGTGTLKTLTIRYYRQYSKAPPADRKYHGWAAIQRRNARAAAIDAREPPPEFTEAEAAEQTRSLF